MFCRGALRVWQIPLACIFLIASVFTGRIVGQASSTNLSEPPGVLLQVVNRHFTVGKRIPSTYLKVLSDGTIECQAIDMHDVDAVKTTKISPSELARVTSLLSDSRLGNLSDRYAMQRFVIDSWMEWDITIDRTSLRSKRITLAFAGGSSDSKLPDALRKLGCQILELRRKLYGDDGGYYTPACTGFQPNPLFLWQSSQP